MKKSEQIPYTASVVKRSLASAHQRANQTDKGAGMKLNGDRNQCQGCKEYFNSTHAFDKHRDGDHGINRRCLSSDEMTAKGMFIGGDGFWRGSAMPQSVIQKVAA